jgi:ABC-type branched-subunit amino acid transport system substrate-binding protein
MMRTGFRLLAVIGVLSLVAAGCSSDDGNDATGGDPTTETSSGRDAADIDYEAIGLWDDGPCDEARDPLVVGLTTVFESPVISLGDQARALEAAATAFNARGGANGACIEVHTCDDGANLDQAIACARQLDEAGVHATINDQTTGGPAEVSAAMAEAGIPRVAGNVTNVDWGDPNSYPLDASGTGSTFTLPQALIEEGITDIGVIRVDLAVASALVGLLSAIYEGDAEFVADTPVPGGTTDFSQFILAADAAGAGGVSLALGEQEAVQVVRAAQQVGTDLVVGGTLGTFSHSAVADLGDFAEQMVFMWSYPPATVDLPVYEALRADLAASGDEALQPGTLKAGPMRSWIGLYGLLKVLRDAGTQEFTRQGITQALQQATDVPMLGIFGDESWTPNADHPGLFKRAGTNHWGVYRWDPDADAPDGLQGNFVEVSTVSFDDILCGSPFGAPEPC